MIDRRLFRLVPGLGWLIAGKVACLWVGLLANVAFVFALVDLLGGLLTAADPRRAPAGAGGDGDSLTSVTYVVLDWPVALGVIAAAVLVRYLTTVLGARLGTEASERVKLALRERLYRKMLALGPSYRSRVTTADVVQSAGEGIEQIQSFFELFLPQLFYAVLAPVTLFAVLATFNLPTAVTLLVCAPLIVLIVGMVAMSASRVFKRYWVRYTDLGSAFLDDVQGMETLKAFDADGRAAARMDARAEQFRRMTMAVLQIQLRSLSAMDLVAYAGTAAGIGVALWQYAAGAPGVAGAPMWLSIVALVVLLSADFFIPLRQLGSYFHVAMNGMTSTRRIFALLDAPEPRRGTVALSADAAHSGLVVRFAHVGFTYQNSGENGSNGNNGNSGEGCINGNDGNGEASGAPAPALTDVTFTARPGQVTAIVGVSGSGKSTAAALLAGTITGYRGHLTLTAGTASDTRSVELADLDGDSLARTVTLVGARSHLFRGTLRSNLLMARPDAADDELWHALAGARIDDFVRAQPDGLDMPIEQDAANCSGGQRQRIAIARALLHASPVIVFDEATSSVDVDSETAILETVRETADAGVTVIMITHRMANAVDADAIAVFDHGRVVETGTHAALLAADGTYARLYHTQQTIESIAHPASAYGSRRLGLSAQTTGSGSDAADFDGADKSSPAVDHDVAAQPAGSGSGDAAAGTGTVALIRRLLREARPLSGCMTGAVLAGTVGHLAATFLPVFGMVAAFALAGHPVWGMGTVPACVMMGVCALLRGVMRYVEQYLNHNVAFRLLALFRSKAFAALRRLAPARVSGKGRGNLVSLMTTDVELLEIFFAHTISPVVIAITTTVMMAVAALTLSPWMALLLMGAHLVIGVVVPKFFATGVQNLGPAIRHQASELDNVMLDDLRGLEEIIRFGCGEQRVAAIVKRTKQLWAEHARLSRVNGWFSAVGGALVSLLTAVAALLAAWLGGAVPHSAPVMVVAVVLIAGSFGPTLALSALPANLTQTFASARRLFALMDEAPAVEETGTATPAWSGMRMDHVTFRYPAAGGGTVPVLEDFSLDVPARGVLGVQGPSGRGKSTLLKLLMRYWDPQTGEVRLSDVPLPAVDAHYRRRVQTMMTQETHLFDGTIRDNLLLALPEEEVKHDETGGTSADDGEGSPAESVRSTRLDALLRDACRRASVLDLIDSLPQGFDTPVGELGGRLSEGERQRIGLARVFLREADLVLFDEPTSRLDALNEAVILQSINRLAHGGSDTAAGHDDAAAADGRAVPGELAGTACDRAAAGTAVILVSHRESAMRIADRILQP